MADITSGRARRLVSVGSLTSAVGGSYLWQALKRPFQSDTRAGDDLLAAHIRNAERIVAGSTELRGASVVIVVAGMEGALPSVVGGLVAVPVIAVPTSVGYGASFGGVAALLGMLNSCASGVTVVNIDNGFGAACAASRINLLS